MSEFMPSEIWETVRSIGVENEELRAEVKRLRNLAEVHKEYEKLLVDEINELVCFADTTWWKSSRYEKGCELREKIKALEG